VQAIKNCQVGLDLMSVGNRRFAAVKPEGFCIEWSRRIYPTAMMSICRIHPMAMYAVSRLMNKKAAAGERRNGFSKLNFIQN